MAAEETAVKSANEKTGSQEAQMNNHTNQKQHSKLEIVAFCIASFAWLSITVTSLFALYVALEFGFLASIPAFASLMGSIFMLAFAYMLDVLRVIADQGRETMNLTRTLVEQNRSQPD